MFSILTNFLKNTVRKKKPGIAREPTLRRRGAVERTEQHGNTTAGGVTARRRHPQEHDERFS